MLIDYRGDVLLTQTVGIVILSWINT